MDYKIILFKAKSFDVVLSTDSFSVNRSNIPSSKAFIGFSLCDCITNLQMPKKALVNVREYRRVSAE